MKEQIILGLGTETNTTFSILEKNQLYSSEVYKDLTNPEIYQQYKKNIYEQIKRKKIDCIACNLHPDYMSTQFAQQLQKELNNPPLVQIQHHHAHLASVLNEHNIQEEAIGFAFDGTGYGTDGNSWGGEIMLCNQKDYQRLYHLQYIPQPGGDKAVSEPWRMAISYLANAFPDLSAAIYPNFFNRIGQEKIQTILTMIQKNINSPLTSSMGRLFDAVSSLLGICDFAQFPAQGPIQLEKIIDKTIIEVYEFTITDGEINLLNMIKTIIEDIGNKVPLPQISAKFHNTIVQIVYQLTQIISKKTKIKNIVLSGGVFLNQFLNERLKQFFTHSIYKLYSNIKYPASDVNISIGQIAIARHYN